MKNKRIFTSNFSGTLDELSAFTQENADFVESVIDEKEGVILTNKEAIAMLKEEMPGISNEEAERLVNEMKLEMIQEVIDSLMEKGLMEVKDYGADGQELYGPTELGKKCTEELNKNENNEKK
jgi:hypothetical protein